MEKILVVGATGTTGKKIVQLLKASTYFEPIAMVRKESQVKDFSEQQVKTVLADLEGDVSLTTNHIDKVIFAAGSGGKKVVEIDQEGAKKMIDASQNNTVKKFVMLSSIGADQPEKASDLKDYLRAKHHADEYLKQSKVPYAIVRPGALTNDGGNQKIEIGTSLNKSGSISREDVAQVLTRMLHDDAAQNTSFEILSGDMLIGKALDSIRHH